MAAQRSDVLRSVYLQDISQFSAEQLCFCDESAFTEKTTRRRFGWAKKGEQAHVSHDYGRAECWSLLPLLSISGFETMQLIQDSYNEESFSSWIEHNALPAMRPFPQPKSVLVLDNAPIHNDEKLQALCAAVGVRLVKLPPYSPDFSPIEMCFGQIKRDLRSRHRDTPSQGLEVAILDSASKAITPEIAIQFYRACGYTYAGEEALLIAQANWEDRT